MITININVKSDVTGNVYDRVIQITDQDIVRILQAMNAKFFNDTSTPVDELMQKTTEIFDRVVDTFWGSIRTITRDYETNVAKETAVAQVTTIEEIRG